jgi:hypothetical protein
MRGSNVNISRIIRRSVSNRKPKKSSEFMFKRVLL